jgi:hypothetical protein
MALELFPGSLEEYERLKGCKYEIVDTGKLEKFIASNDLDAYNLEKKDNVTALIRYFLDTGDHIKVGYGIPVRKKK